MRWVSTSGRCDPAPTPPTTVCCAQITLQHALPCSAIMGPHIFSVFISLVVDTHVCFPLVFFADASA